MLSNIQNLLVKSDVARWIFDIIYVILPILLVLFTVKDFNGKKILAISTAVFSLLYGVFFSSISYISMEGYIGWILIPLIFSASNAKDFYYKLHVVRLIFILVFFSSALWKMRAGGLFNIEEMAGILLQQHNAYLTSSKGDWFTDLIYYLVKNKTIAYCLYLFAAIGELLFAVGLFTRKLDKYLIVVFCLFIIADFFLMRINYFGWIAFMGCFYFSKFSLQNDK